jgi:cytidine deaminase
MQKEEVRFDLSTYDSIDELSSEDAFLLREAQAVTRFAYAPYSHFQVGAFARLDNGKTISGTNQENASFPAGICAERTLLSAAAVFYPGVAIQTIAISYDNLDGTSDRPISPCGICRQSLVEFQERTSKPIRIVMGGLQGKVQLIEDASYLLPLGFNASDFT